MKKRLVGIISGIIALILSFTVSAFAYNTGDVDGNGKHTAADARLVLRYSAKLENFNAEQKKAADVDNNGKVSAADARYILRVSAKLDKPFGQIDTEKHLMLQNRKKAGCQTFTGKITPVIVFVNDPVNKWDDKEKKTIMNECDEVVKEIQRQAALYGQKPVIKPDYKTAQITCNIKDNGWDIQALKSAGLPSEGVVNDALEKQYGVNEAPVVFVVNSEGRAFATGNAGFEYVVLYNSIDGMFHELCHVFGAPDYYYPDLVNKVASEMFPDSIMLNGKKVDAVTAYNIGWTDKLSEAATEFLKKTAYVTEKDIDAALENQWFTGYATDWVTSFGVYDGYIKDGTFEGQGTIKYNDGASYSGNWSNGVFDGYGVYIYTDGGSYDGYWENGTQHGQGTLTYASGAVYSGNWKNGSLDGYGIFTYSDGSEYNGYWKNGKQEGQGTLTYTDGSVFSGNWLNAKRDGYGVIIYGSGAKYDGYWKADRFDGYGIYYFTNGDIFKGDWVGGIQHGNGIYIFSNGTSVSGVWQNGNYIG